ncbi:MAG: hypothetical protein HC888_15470 [Candidatus Competibacteraceae bacterium]|nr:hypothetical protein [Candidatus Competibacteraceae bacterium]
MRFNTEVGDEKIGLHADVLDIDLGGKKNNWSMSQAVAPRALAADLEDRLRSGWWWCCFARLHRKGER